MKSHQVYQNGTLIINKVRLADRGFYRCIATNNDNLKTVFSIRVEVLCELLVFVYLFLFVILIYSLYSKLFMI